MQVFTGKGGLWRQPQIGVSRYSSTDKRTGSDRRRRRGGALLALRIVGTWQFVVQDVVAHMLSPQLSLRKQPCNRYEVP